MPHASLIDRRCSASVLIAALLLCGCKDSASPSEHTREQAAASSVDESARDSIARSGAIESQERAARMARLSADIDAAVAHRTELQQQRAAMDARRVAHEEQGMAMLDSLQSEMRERARQGRDDAAFRADALAKLEGALAQDDALTTSLREVDTRIAETNAAIERLSAERKKLQASTPSSMAASQE